MAGFSDWTLLSYALRGTLSHRAHSQTSENFWPVIFPPPHIGISCPFL